MAPISTTSIIFKDFVNDGKVPVENFVVKQDQVSRRCMGFACLHMA